MCQTYKILADLSVILKLIVHRKSEKHMNNLDTYTSDPRISPLWHC